MTVETDAEMRDKNAATAVFVVAIVVGMIGLTFAAVPLYRWFCAVTGFGGTTQIADAGTANMQVLDRTVTVRFNASTHRDMPWDFKPLQNKVDLRVGESTLVFYEAANNTDAPVAGTATFNVTPLKAGQYFNKVQCFCFTEQVLAAGQDVSMPVELFIDPAIADDPNMDDIDTITLSYTFFRDDDWEDAVALQ